MARKTRCVGYKVEWFDPTILAWGERRFSSRTKAYAYADNLQDLFKKDDDDPIVSVIYMMAPPEA